MEVMDGVSGINSLRYIAVRCAALRWGNFLPTARCGPLGTRCLVLVTRNGVRFRFTQTAPAGAKGGPTAGRPHRGGGRERDEVRAC